MSATLENSKVPELIRELEEFSINVDAIDPFADPVEFKEEYNIDMIDAPNKNMTP
jgi:UDP-N-acetyl-D-galactosamine dehydrogenase